MNEQIKSWAVIANPSSKEIYNVADSWPYNCAAWSGEELDKFAELVIKSVLEDIADAPSQHCAYTTYDLNVVNCTKAKIAEHIKTKYNIKYNFAEKKL